MKRHLLLFVNLTILKLVPPRVAYPSDEDECVDKYVSKFKLQTVTSDYERKLKIGKIILL